MLKQRRFEMKHFIRNLIYGFLWGVLFLPVTLICMMCMVWDHYKARQLKADQK